MQTKTLQEYWAGLKEQIINRKEKGEPEHPTGLAFIDDITDGIHKGEVWIIAGKAGSGKTSLGLQIARSVADNPKTSVLFLSLEMTGEELIGRMFCEMNRVNFTELTRGKWIEGWKEKNNIFIDFIQGIDFEICEYGYTFKEVEKIIQSGYKDKNPDVVFIDFIQLVEGKEKTEREVLMAYTRRLKELAKRKGMAIVILSQLRRQPSGADYNRPPDITDLLGSGSLEQTADKVLLIYKIKHKGTEETSYFINIAKNRQGAVKKEEVEFNGAMYRFSELKENQEREKAAIEGGKFLDNPSQPQPLWKTKVEKRRNDENQI